MMAEESGVFDYAKKHYLLVGGVALGVVALILIVRSSGSSGAVASTGIDPTELALAAQQAQQQTALQGNAQTIAGQQALATTQAQYGLDLAGIQANAAITTTNVAAGVQNLQTVTQGNVADTTIAAQLQEALGSQGVANNQIQAAVAESANANQTSEDIAALTAGEQTAIANTLGQTQIAISNNQTQATIATVNANASLGKAAINAGTTNSLLGAAGSIIGGALAFL